MAEEPIPADEARLDELSDVSREAALLLKGKLIDRRAMDLRDLATFVKGSAGASYLLTGSTPNHRMVIHVEDGRVVSAAVEEMASGRRASGRDALARLGELLGAGAIPFNIFVLGEEGTIISPRRISAPALEEAREATRPIKAEARRAVVAEATDLLARKLTRFVEEALSVVRDVAEFEGCEVADVSFALSRGTLTVRVTLKRGLLRKCDARKLEGRLKGDVALVSSSAELELPVEVVCEVAK
ncbi:MAG: hypothetical protein ABWK00_01600 [Desulfurococcaceae archaeon]